MIPESISKLLLSPNNDDKLLALELLLPYFDDVYGYYNYLANIIITNRDMPLNDKGGIIIWSIYFEQNKKYGSTRSIP